MKVSDLMQAMADAGAPMEAILIAVKAIEESQDAIETRRAGERERKRRQRAKSDEKDGTVTGQSRDNAVTVTDEAHLSLPPNENISNPPTHTPGNNTRARKGTVLAAKPEAVSDQVWGDFQALRKRKGSPLTETALAGIADEARKAGWPLEAALKKCVVRGWQGFEADWLKGEKPPSAAHLPEADPLMRSIMARRAREGAE